MLRLNVECTLKITREIILDPAKKANQEGYCCVVGRSPSIATDCLDDMRISGQHFGIKFMQGRAILVDLSSNGTWHSSNDGVSEVKIGTHKSAEIKVGDRIRILKTNDGDPSQHVFYQVPKMPATGGAGANAMDVDNDNVAMAGMAAGAANTLAAGDTQNGAMPSQKQLERTQRFDKAVSRVKREMEITRKALEVTNNMDRRFDPFAIEDMLETS